MSGNFTVRSTRLVVNGVRSTVVSECDSVRDGTYLGFQLYHDQVELTRAITVVVTQQYFKLRFCFVAKLFLPQAPLSSVP
jgi:hypothetical protein